MNCCNENNVEPALISNYATDTHFQHCLYSWPPNVQSCKFQQVTQMEVMNDVQKMLMSTECLQYVSIRKMEEVL